MGKLYFLTFSAALGIARTSSALHSLARKFVKFVGKKLLFVFVVYRLYSCAVLFGVFVIGVSCVLYLMMFFQNMIAMIPIITS